MFRCLESVLPQSGMQLDKEPSPPSPRCPEQESEPTTDGEPEPAVTDEPSANGVTELRIAPRACNVRPGVIASCRARHGGERHGQRECGGKLRPLHHG